MKESNRAYEAHTETVKIVIKCYFFIVNISYIFAKNAIFYGPPMIGIMQFFNIIALSVMLVEAAWVLTLLGLITKACMV